jgi:hypothetical protein
VKLQQLADDQPFGSEWLWLSDRSGSSVFGLSSPRKAGRSEYEEWPGNCFGVRSLKNRFLGMRRNQI